ncbi:MAG: amidase [Deltaproteobacteria bacterium]|nr:amidase [Deltaproteobacteria bacterium]
MTSFPDYDQYDGIGLAKLVKNGNISSLEICEEAIRRAENLNPKLNAIITTMYDFAREDAKRPNKDARFGGVPFLLKDVHHALKGFTMSSGSELLRNYVPGYDAEIVSRFKKAGLIILGKTNTPEFKLSYVTEPKSFGPTRNPWNLDYSCGGSSGGSASAVASGIVPFASATDEGGSIRVPASYCGLFGLKPSRGRNPIGPDFDEEWDGMSHSHVVSRSVRDSAAILDAVSGFEYGAPYGIVEKERPFIEEVNTEPGRLKIAFHMKPAYGKNVNPECRKAVEQTCTLLENLGHVVEEAAPDYREEAVALNWWIILIGNEAALVDRLIQEYGMSMVRNNLELPNIALYSIGKELKVLDFVKAKRSWRQLGVVMDRMLNTYDMVLTPTLGEPPVAVGSQQPNNKDRFSMKLISSFVGKLILSSRNRTYSILEELTQNTMKEQMPFTLIANITGQPAMSVPLYWSKDGLPCGVQFIGRYGGEAKLLRLAGQLEKAQPWSGRKPRILSEMKTNSSL